MAKGVFVIFNRSYDNPICGVFTNLSKVHDALCDLMNDDFAPAYSKVLADFKERKDYLCYRRFYDNDDNCRQSFEVEYTELNFNSIA
jgi:hypothetical protein